MKKGNIACLSFSEKGRALANTIAAMLDGEAACTKDGVSLADWTAIFHRGDYPKTYVPTLYDFAVTDVDHDMAVLRLGAFAGADNVSRHSVGNIRADVVGARIARVVIAPLVGVDELVPD